MLPACLDCMPLHDAVIFNDLPLLRSLLAQGGYNLNKRDLFLNTPLHIAVIVNNVEAAKILLEYGANPNSIGANENTPLITACKKLNLDLVELLIENDATIVQKDKDQMGPTEMALMNLMESSDDAEAAMASANILRVLKDNGGPAFVGEDTDAEQEFLPISVLLNVLKEIINDSDVLELVEDMIEEYQVGENIGDAFIAAKYLFHTLPNGKSYTLSAKYDSLLFETQGSHKYTLELTQKSISSFAEHALSLSDSNISKIFSSIAEKFAQATQLRVNKDMFDVVGTYMDFLSGEPVLIHSGWEGHAIDIILSNKHNLMIVCNSGARAMLNPGGAKYYQIPPNTEISVEDIYNISQNKDQAELEMDFIYEHGLKLVDIKDYMGQKWGNCEFYSQTIALRELLRLEFEELGYSEQDIAEKTDYWLNEWVDFNKVFAIENYLEQDVDLLPTEALMDLLLEVKDPNNTSNVEFAKRVIEYLSEGDEQGVWAKFVQNYPLKWLGIEDVLEACDINFQTGKLNKHFDISDIIQDSDGDIIVYEGPDFDACNQTEILTQYVSNLNLNMHCNHSEEYVFA